ncbi:MAG: hypothetical protein AAFX87_03895 [Bacteroidota bacterium]
MKDQFYLVINAEDVVTTPLDWHSRHLYESRTPYLEDNIRRSISMFEGVCDPENIFVLCDQRKAGMLMGSLTELNKRHIIPLPGSKASALSMAAICAKVSQKGEQAQMIFTPINTIQPERTQFIQSLYQALFNTCFRQIIIALGVVEKQEVSTNEQLVIDSTENTMTKKVWQLVKSKNMRTNRQSTSFETWQNSRIYIGHASTFLNAFKQHKKEAYQRLALTRNVFNTPDEQRYINRMLSLLSSATFEASILPKISNLFTLPIHVKHHELDIENITEGMLELTGSA